MNMITWRCCVDAKRLIRFMSLLAILSITAICVAQQPSGTLPTVISAKVPIYPELARKLGIEGLVHLHVSTDGFQVREIKVNDGPAMLAAGGWRTPSCALDRKLQLGAALFAFQGCGS